MTPDEPADPREGALIEWLWQQRLALAPKVVAIRDRDGRAAFELLANGRECDELTAGMTDDVTD